MNLKSLKLKQKLTAILLGFGLIPCLMITGVIYYESKEIEKDYTQRLQQIAENTGQNIDNNFFERYGDVQAFAIIEAAKNTSNWGNTSESNPLIKSMNNYVKLYGIYDVMLVLDKNGVVQAINKRATDGKPIKSQNLVGSSFANADWFKKTINGDYLKGGNGLTGTVVTNPQRYQFIDKIYGKNDSFNLIFSTPIKDENGQTIGVWANFPKMDIVEHFAKVAYEELKAKGAPHSEITVLDPQGTAIVHFDYMLLKDGQYVRDFNIVTKENFVNNGDTTSRLAVSGQSGYQETFNEHAGQQNLTGYAYSKGAYDFPGLGWSVIVSTAKSEILSNLHRVLCIKTQSKNHNNMSISY